MTKPRIDSRAWDEPRTGTVPVAETAPTRAGSVPRIIGRYALFDEIASGGMGSVHLGRQIGSAGFERVVAIKRAHQNMAYDSGFVAMFREEIRLLSRIRHQNVVPALDVVEDDGELLLVMEYVHGQPLSVLARQARESGAVIPLEVCIAVACGVLHGLHAVHTAQTPTGEPLCIVHRDVSPQNVLVGCDGLARILDFGVAKASTSGDVTRVGHVKGKLGYIAPEHLLGKALDHRADLYGLSVVLWEMLASARLFDGQKDSETVQSVLAGKIPKLASIAVRRVPSAIEEIVRRGLATDPDARFASARDMALALQSSVTAATAQDVGDWVTATAHAELVERSRQLAWAENCPISEAMNENDPIIETGSYELDDLGDLEEKTVSDAKFRNSILDIETGFGPVDDAEPSEPVTAFMHTQAYLPPSPSGSTEPITRLMPPVALALSASSGAAGTSAVVEERGSKTAPSQRAARVDKVRKVVLYVAAIPAALFAVNMGTHGELIERARGFVSAPAAIVGNAKPMSPPPTEVAVQKPAAIAPSATPEPVAPPEPVAVQVDQLAVAAPLTTPTPAPSARAPGAKPAARVSPKPHVAAQVRATGAPRPRASKPYKVKSISEDGF